MIRFHCVNCGREIEVSDEYIGKQGRCPKCKHVNIVPSVSEQVIGRGDLQAGPPAQPAGQASDSQESSEPPQPALEKKQCPHCGKEIPKIARKCRHCDQLLEATPVQPIPVAAGVSGYGPYGFHYAGFWRRFVALLLDSLILAGAGCIVGVCVGGVIGAVLGGMGEGTEAIQAASGFLGQIIGIVLNWLYFTLFECSAKQATLGKMALGIIVTDIEGNRLSFGRANGRHWAKLISALTFGVGYIMAGFTTRKQALHDIIASCLVVTK